MSLNNCNYNCTQQLGRKLGFLAKVNQYIKDADECGHPACAELFKEIKKDEQKHVDKLKAAIAGLSKEGKFN